MNLGYHPFVMILPVVRALKRGSVGLLTDDVLSDAFAKVFCITVVRAFRGTENGTVRFLLSV